MGGALIVAIVQTGHFLADFYFQSGRMAKRKRNSSFALLAHCVIYAIVMAVFCGGGLICLGAISVESSIVVWAVISVSHGVIDAVKVQIEKRGANQFALFSIDQILHLAIAIASPTIAIYIAGGDCYSGNYMDPVITARIIAAFSTLVFIWKPCMVFIAMLLEQIEKDPDAISDEGDNRNEMLADRQIAAGRWIGVLERVLVSMLTMASSFPAIAFVLAAKSIARFSQLEEDKSFAERYLVGTLASIALAMAYPLILQFFLGF